MNNKALRIIAERLSIIDQRNADLFDPELVASEILDELQKEGFELINVGMDIFDNMGVGSIYGTDILHLADSLERFNQDYSSIVVTNENSEAVKFDLDTPVKV